MKALLNNQKCVIDNHLAGQKVQGLEGLHIHKTYKKDKMYSKATIKIPLDGKNVFWQCSGKNADKLKRECEKALSNPKRNKEFVDVVVNEMARFNNLLNSKTINDLNRQIDERVLSRAFGVNNLEYQTTKRKKVFGKSNYYYIFCDNDLRYSVFLGKTRFAVKGKNNKKNIQK